jgi:hypothetical protein
METLEDERGAGFELGEHLSDVRHAGERSRTPRDALRVRRRVDLLPGLDEAEPRRAQAPGAEKPLDVGDRQEGVIPTHLGTLDDERLLLPVLAEELLDRDRVDRALESA